MNGIRGSMLPEEETPDQVQGTKKQTFLKEKKTAQIGTPKERMKKRKKRKLWLIILSIVLVLALIAGILLYIFVLNSPLLKIYAAAQNTMAQFNEIFENSENLTAWVDSVQQVYDGGDVSLGAEYASTDDDLSLKLQYSSRQAALAGTLAWAQENSTPDVEFSANEEQLMFRFPRLLDKAFYVPLENLGQESADSSYFSQFLPDWVQALDGLDPDLFTDVTLEHYIDAHSEEIEELIDSIDVEEYDEAIEHTRDLMTYRMTLDTQLFTELFLGYLRYVNDARFGEDYDSRLMKSIEWFEELLEEKELSFYVGIDEEERLSAFHLRSEEDGEEESAVTIVLSGQENIFNELGVWIDGEQALSGGFVKEPDGFTIAANAYTLRSYDDKERIELSWEERSVILQYGINDTTSDLAVQYGEHTLQAQIKPLKQSVVMIDSDPTNLFEMGLLDWLEVITTLAGENLL